MLTFGALMMTGCSDSKNNVNSVHLQNLPTHLIKTTEPLTISYHVTGSKIKKLNLVISNPGDYATLNIYANDTLLFENLNIARTGKHTFNALVEFPQQGDTALTFKVNNTDITLHSASFEDVADLTLPAYTDITQQAGLDSVNSIKYAGPTIADIDNDGDYDFIVNNHNQESSKLYWNNGDGTVTKHDKNLARWFMHDLHGTAMGDYDNDGDLDLVVTQGGGNGTDPSKANFYTNSDGTLVLTTGDVAIDKGGRGRGAKFSDMDLDGDLDLMLINETSLNGETPQHFFYENIGDGKFQRKRVKGIEDQHPSRALITDINNDNIDDIILYGPLSIWQGNGDFTFTDVTSSVPTNITNHKDIMAITDIDIDNDGDLDLYLARGKEFEWGKGEAPSVDTDPIKQTFSIKPRGYKGVDEFNFDAEGDIKFHQYYYLAQGSFRGKDYPIFLGRDKTPTVLSSGAEMIISAKLSQGWPDDISQNGIYFGQLRSGRWKAALVRNGDIFWGFKFSLQGVKNVQTDFKPENRNISDILLRNDNGQFTDVSKQWNLPAGGNSLGVTTGDFNNDSHQDIFVYRWGNIAARISDAMLLNDGNDQFHTVTSHGANDVGGPGNGDMGQAFDFNLDGNIDLLNGSEGGQWYLYKNTPAKNTENNYALVRVGYSPDANIDATSAEVTIETSTHRYRKRVGSAGAVFSQSLLNTVHFGLGKTETIKSINVRWRNGETVNFNNKPVNHLYSTDSLDPTSLTLSEQNPTSIREGTSIKFQAKVTPNHADTRLMWASSDEAILSVDQHGIVTALGKNADSAMITITSKANNLSTSRQVNITKWQPIPIESINILSLDKDSTNQQLKSKPTLFVGQSLSLAAKPTPRVADNNKVNWTSSNTSVATVDQSGTVTAIGSGKAIISATVLANEKVSDQVEVAVKQKIEPYIRVSNKAQLEKMQFTVGGSITLKVDYHAGSNNTVIASDEGGIRFWFRHFKSKWIPVKDTVLTDPSVLGSEFGQSTMTLTLDDVIPTEQLPEGHFYLLRSSFVSSDGTMNDVNIYPINIVESQH